MTSGTRLQGRVALVTGASNGIGKATALQLAREDVGTRLALCNSAGPVAPGAGPDFPAGRHRLRCGQSAARNPQGYARGARCDPAPSRSRSAASHLLVCHHLFAITTFMKR